MRDIFNVGGLTLLLFLKSDANLFTKSNCTRYDDDNVFTADVCEDYDKAICFFGTEVITTPCKKSYWCKRLCGSECDLGSGAVCFFDRLSRLSHTCEIVSAIVTKIGYVPIYADLDGNANAVDNEEYGKLESLEGYGLDYNASDDGCGKHAYCTFCEDDCNADRMGHWVATQYHHRIITALAAQMAVVDIVNTCAHFGYLHEEVLELMDIHSTTTTSPMSREETSQWTKTPDAMIFGTFFVVGIFFIIRHNSASNIASQYNSVS